MNDNLRKLEKEFFEFLFGEEERIKIDLARKEKQEQVEIDTNVIDIHTKKKTEDNSRYQKSINSEAVKDYVFQNIDFELPEDYWLEIDSSFADVWNNKLGIGKDFYWDEISTQVFNQIQSKKIFIEFQRIDRIVNLMLTFIEKNGGFL